MRKIPSEAVAIIKKYEGLRLTGYLCPAGVPTAGWGHTGDDVQVGVKYTQAQANKWLMADITIAHNKLARVVKADVLEDLTDGQYAALLSFVFNLGAKGSWTIWKRVNARQFDLVPMELQRFVNAGGKRLPGLVRRRAEESVLWETPDDDEPEVPPSTTTRQVGMTPPTPTDAPKAPVITALLGTTASVPLAAQQVQQALAPYSEHSPWVGQAVAFVATIAAVAAVVVLVLTWLQHRQAKR